MSVLLVTPQQTEFDYLLEGLRSEGCEVDSVSFGPIQAVKTHDYAMTIAVGGHGKAQFAVQTQYLIPKLSNVELVICAGAAGALVDHLSFGDVVVATRTIEHDYKLRFVDRSLPVHAGHEETITQLQGLADRTTFPFDILFGRVASGDEDIIDRERAHALHDQTDALCVAWEGSGGARAAAFNQVPFLEVRVVTDAADGTAPADYEENLAHTVPNISSLLVRWLRDGVE